ncbi:cation:proton antiporter [Persicirhabdus sediminis]|uniref:Cation:proton antiporter n=1 Tax=Persicirhabdus sediminis TaxID=454144 RepID=A0A8J7MFH6_9BACT|nr:cation:proton antiporter [Persicirhabdus sediminis]MBK1791791.1 cation:proton antiporter [Persicirhabdus sediminis]
MLTFSHLAASAHDVSPFFALLALVLVMSVLVALLLVRFKQSLLVGYFICGVVVANSGLLEMVVGTEGSGLITVLAEFGIILLMFTLGVEFPLKELKHMWKLAFIGGGVQMGLSSLVIGGIAYAAGMPASQAVVLGIALGLSSTAVSLKSFQDMGLGNHPAARMSLGIALFQDILVIAVMLLLPSMLGGSGDQILSAMALAGGKGILFILAAWLLGVYVIPKMLDQVAFTRSRELFTLTVIGLCAAIAYAGAAMNLSLALGAFCAGLIVSGSIYSHRILSEILPFKDLFLTLFFVSIGLLIDVSVAMEHWLTIAMGVFVLIHLKALILLLAARCFKLPLGPALLSAGALASSGEFSLVLLTEANVLQPMPEFLVQMLLISTAVSMGLVPSLMRFAPTISDFVNARRPSRKRHVPAGALSASHRVKELQDHAIIIGYGPVGQALNESLRQHNIPTLIVELNAKTVRKLYESGQAAIFADATHHETMELAKVADARMVAYTFPTVETTLKSLPLLRAISPEVIVYGRAKFSNEVEMLDKAGVIVIHDERESSRALIDSALATYSV